MSYTLDHNEDGTLLIKNATEGLTVQDSEGFNTIIKEITGEGLELTIYDGVNAPTVYKVEDGKLKNVLAIKATVYGVDNQTITDQIAAAGKYLEKGDIIKSEGSSYMVISAESDLTNAEYNVDFNDIGELAFEGQIATAVNAALTAELSKLGRTNWTTGERIQYLDGVSKVVEVTWAKRDTENKKYVVNCGVLT